MTDTKLLRDKIKDSGYKMNYIARKCGLSYQGFLNKVNDVYAFNAREIIIIRDILQLSPEEVQAIFFAEEVDKTAT